MSTMEYERGIFVLERQIGLRKRLADLAEECRKRGLGDSAAETLGTLTAQLEVLRAHPFRPLAAQEAGTTHRGATSVDKLLLTHTRNRLELGTGAYARVSLVVRRLLPPKYK